MHLLKSSRIVAAATLLSLAPAAGVANAQTPTCVAATGPLTTQQQSIVNDYEILVARAQSKHTPIPIMSDQVAVLIGCLSPASQTGSTTASNTTASTTSTTPTGTAAVTATAPCPPNGLSKAQLSMINDYEILVARANSKHTAVPAEPQDIANLIACQ
jgi:hypothetical protein